MAVREIVKDPDFLSQKSEVFIFRDDKHIIQDMLDTAEAHRENCAGLAAIQIGEPKKIILVRMNDKFVPFINPHIIKKSPGTYCTMEGCLSIDGQRSVKRHHTIMVAYTTAKGKFVHKQFSGNVAQIIQHEVDHLNGILIGKEV